MTNHTDVTKHNMKSERHARQLKEELTISISKQGNLRKSIQSHIITKDTI